MRKQARLVLPFIAILALLSTALFAAALPHDPSPLPGHEVSTCNPYPAAVLASTSSSTFAPSQPSPLTHGTPCIIRRSRTERTGALSGCKLADRPTVAQSPILRFISLAHRRLAREKTDPDALAAFVS